MHEIICPHCKKAFKIDEAGYADILKQVRDSDFEQQLQERLELAEREKSVAVELVQARAAGELQQAIAEKSSQIIELNARLDAFEIERQLAVTQALHPVIKERDELINQLHQVQNDQQTAVALAEARMKSELEKTAAAKDAEIQALKARLDNVNNTHKLALNEAVGAITQERMDLKSALERAELEKALSEKSLKEKYETQIKDREDMIETVSVPLASKSRKMKSPLLPLRASLSFSK